MPFLGVTLSIRESWLPVMSKRSFLMAFDRVNFFISAIVFMAFDNALDTDNTGWGIHPLRRDNCMTHDQQLIAGLFFPPLAQLERARSFYLCGSGFESSMAYN